MPVLATFIGGLFSGLFSFLVTVMGVRLAVATAAVAAFGALTLALYALVAATFTGLTAAIPGGHWVGTGIWLVYPDTGPACVAAILTVDGAMALYRWNVENVRLAAGA